MAQQQHTGASDHQYDLVSVLYHALEGAKTYEMYIQDAQKQGDPELSKFFTQARQEEQNRAQQAMQLLGSRIRA